MAREPRFPGIDWYCDNCNAHLNSQDHFDDHKYTWRCKKCGYKNSISWDNINPDDNTATKFLLHVLGFLSFVGFETSIMLAIAMFVFGADHRVYFPTFLVFLGIYLFAFIISILVEFFLRHTSFSLKNLLFVIFRNLKEDILAPFWFAKEIVSNFLSFITNLLPFKRKYIWHSNLKIITLSGIYLLIIIGEICVFSRIVGFGLNEWSILLNKAIELIKQLVIIGIEGIKQLVIWVKQIFK